MTNVVNSLFKGRQIRVLGGSQIVLYVNIALSIIFFFFRLISVIHLLNCNRTGIWRRSKSPRTKDSSMYVNLDNFKKSKFNQTPRLKRVIMLPPELRNQSPQESLL